MGIAAYTFEYKSKVEYTEPTTLVSVSEGGKVFDRLYSKWHIQPLSDTSCETTYEISMEFSNSLFEYVTRYFFDTMA